MNKLTSPSEHFGRKWSVESVQADYVNAEKMSAPWGSLIPVPIAIIAPILVFPAGLALTALVGIPAIGNFIHLKSKEKLRARDFEVVAESFPIMQADLNQVLESSRQLSTLIRCSDGNQDVKLDQIDALRATVEEFYRVNFGQDLNDFDLEQAELPIVIRLGLETISELEDDISNVGNIQNLDSEIVAQPPFDWSVSSQELNGASDTIDRMGTEL